ncbi:hypothetical protein L6452_15326 [Arctium lappa]|uniref:Uncharacterized protein n=1 Tax=Arctium lappa TaxID=4217 RepID=A0ACB9CNA8_ARCLA|nr:hypothetical protein L6452_15326 [Arctium lappa]
MENPDLEHVPPDLCEKFLENQKLVSAPIVVDFDVQIGDGVSNEGIDPPGKTNRLKIKEESSIKEFLMSSLGFNITSLISNSIRKRIPKRLLKKKGSITGGKGITVVSDLVNSTLANKIDRSADFHEVERIMEVETGNNPSEDGFSDKGNGYGNMEGRGFGTGGEGEHFFSFGSDTGDIKEKRVVDSIKYKNPEVIMTESVEVSSGKGTGAVKQPVNVWSSEGITLAYKIKGKTDSKFFLR